MGVEAEDIGLSLGLRKEKILEFGILFVNLQSQGSKVLNDEDIHRKTITTLCRCTSRCKNCTEGLDKKGKKIELAKFS